MTDRELVARIARSAGQKAGYKQLVRELSLGGGRERRLLLEQLARLTARGELVKLDREHWSIPRPIAGRHARQPCRGPARSASRRLWLCAAQRAARRSGLTDDIFIPPNEINGAMQGDQVLVEVEPPKADGRRRAALCA